MALPPVSVRRGRRLRRLGRPREDSGRHRGEEARPRDLRGADDAADRPGPAPAGRGGRPGGRRLFAAVRRRGLLGEGRADPRVGYEAARDAVPGRGALGRRDRRAANSPPARRGRADERRTPRGDGDARRRRVPRAAPLGSSSHRRRKDGAFQRGRRAARKGRRRPHPACIVRAARLLGLSQPRRQAPRRPRSRAVGTPLRRPSGEGRLLPSRAPPRRARGGAGRRPRAGPKAAVRRSPLRHVPLDPLGKPRDGLGLRESAPLPPRTRRPARRRPVRSRPGTGPGGPPARHRRDEERGADRHPLPAPRAGNGNGRRGPRRRGAPSERPLFQDRPRHRRSRSARRPREGLAGTAPLHRPDRRGEARGLPRRLPTGPPPAARQRVATAGWRSALPRAAPGRPPARGVEGAPGGRPSLRGEGRRPEAARRLRRAHAASSRRVPLRLGRPIWAAGENDDRAGIRDGPGRLPREGPRRARPAPPLGAGPGRRPSPPDRARRREARVGRGDPRALPPLQVRHALHGLPRGPPLAAPAAPDPAGRPDPEDRGAPGNGRHRRPSPLRPEARPDPPSRARTSGRGGSSFPTAPRTDR